MKSKDCQIPAGKTPRVPGYAERLRKTRKVLDEVYARRYGDVARRASKKSSVARCN